MDQPMQSVGFFRYMGVLFYEAFILMAVLLFSGFLIIPALLLMLGVSSQGKQIVLLPEWAQWLVFFLMLAVCFAYFAWCWVRCQGQTLPMRTWGVRLLSVGDAPVTLQQAFVRYGVAVFGLAFLGAAIIWRWFDREGLLLQDRLSGTRLIRVPR